MLLFRYGITLGKVFLLWTAVTMAWLEPSVAQVQPDGTVGTKVETNTQAQIYQISGGTQAQQNLLHSFLNFSVEEGWTASFQLSEHPNVLNIVARVTGSDISQIFGTLHNEDVGHPVSLFLINPNGIIFGPNAKLDLSGSFLASTADSVVFENGYKFNAKDPTASLPVLILGVPIGLQFGTNPAPILGQFTQPEEDFGVRDGQTLALVGGDISLQGTGDSFDDLSFVTANYGRIDIGSVGAGEIVKLSAPNNNRSWALDFSGVQTYKDLTISDSLIVFGVNTDVFLHGRQVRVVDGVQIAGLVSPSEKKDVTISITASDLFELTNSTIIPSTASSASGGNVEIKTKTLRLSQEASINTSANSDNPVPGLAGSISINAEQVYLTDKSSIESNGAQASSGGNIFITTGSLNLDQGSKLSVVSQGTGSAGSINIFARSILLDHRSIIRGTTTSGKGGSLDIGASDALVLRNQSNISTSSITTGNGGIIKILAGVIAAVPHEDSNISTDAVFGNGGNIEITTQGLFGISPNTSNMPNTSDITARSEFGVDGTIDTSLISATPVGERATLPVILGQKILKTECFGTSRSSNRDSFIYSGRGGLPTTPADPDQNMAVWQDFRTIPLVLSKENSTSTVLPTVASQNIAPVPQPIIEAQGFSFEADGSVHLVASSSASAPPSQACAATQPTSAEPSSASALGH
jgi:filamentous hemagglutinin family protein